MERTNDIMFIHDYTSLPIPEKKLLSMAKKVIAEEICSRGCRVDVIFCSDYKIKSLNHEYLNKNRQTDVIAFPFDEEDLLGEIYISLQRAASQAKRFDNPYDEEVVLLFVHGFLHLVGYDDTSEPERQRMLAREEHYGCFRQKRATVKRR
jgi:probable rRNA maturation factor